MESQNTKRTVLNGRLGASIKKTCLKRFYERYYQADTKLLQAVAVLPWGHNLLLLPIDPTGTIYN
jgi:hypothetical protein